MARSRITLDHAGIGEILRSDTIAALISAEAEAVRSTAYHADTLHRHHAEVVVDNYTTDRAASSVTIRHPGGQNMEAKYGILTGAAAANGLEVSDGAT